MQILLSNSQTGPGRKVKQEQEEISRNHVQAFFPGSVHLLLVTNLQTQMRVGNQRQSIIYINVEFCCLLMVSWRQAEANVSVVGSPGVQDTYKDCKPCRLD